MGQKEAAMRMAHNLKSVSGAIAVRAVHPAAAELERACSDGTDDANVETLVRRVAQLLGPVISELQALGRPTHPFRAGAGLPVFSRACSRTSPWSSLLRAK